MLEYLLIYKAKRDKVLGLNGNGVRNNSNDGSIVDNIDNWTLETVVCLISLSLCMVMSGSGNLNVFKILRELRKPISDNISYGHYMMYNMAIGFLFLGGGRLTLGIVFPYFFEFTFEVEFAI